MLANIGTFSRQPTFPKPWEMAAHVCYAFKPKSLNRLGANVRDGFFNRIRRVNQIQIRGADFPTLRHLFDEGDQLLPVIRAHDDNRKMFDLPVLNQSERFEETRQGCRRRRA